MPVVVSNLQDVFEIAYLEKQVSRLLQKALVHTGFEDSEVSLVFVDDEYIKDLNFRYRQKDTPTDVLSFALRETGEGEPELLDDESDEVLGDIVISLETAAKQSEEAGHALLDEVRMLAVHGLLHLIGFDHCTDDEFETMEAKQKEIMALV